MATLTGCSKVCDMDYVIKETEVKRRTYFDPETGNWFHFSWYLTIRSLGCVVCVTSLHFIEYSLVLTVRRPVLLELDDEPEPTIIVRVD